MATGGDNSTADALNRIADALFQAAKAQRAQIKVSERQVAVAEQMAELQKANLAVTKHLEAELALRAGGGSLGSA